MEHHQKLEDYFLGFSFIFFSREPKLLRDAGGLTIFVFLPERMKNHDSQFLGFSTKLKKHKYHSRRHEIDSFYATHHGFHFCSMGGTQTWKLFQENSMLPNRGCRENRFPKTLVSSVPFGLRCSKIQVFPNGILIEETLD
jgi:hypothetical protein